MRTKVKYSHLIPVKVSKHAFYREEVRYRDQKRTVMVWVEFSEEKLKRRKANKLARKQRKFNCKNQ